MNFTIHHNSTNPAITYSVTDNETYFINSLLKKAQEHKLNKSFRFRRMANSSICIDYHGLSIGRIKLRGKNTYMQVLITRRKHNVLENLSLEEYVTSIDILMTFINKYL